MALTDSLSMRGLTDLWGEVSFSEIQVTLMNRQFCIQITAPQECRFYWVSCRDAVHGCLHWVCLSATDDTHTPLGKGVEACVAPG
jgi:hypothetical protein